MREGREVVLFTVPGEPVAKGRPRFARLPNGGTRTYTPEKTANYENWVRLNYQSTAGTKRYEDGAELKMSIVAYYGIPKSATKKKREQMMLGQIRPTRKPDVDNIVKGIADALNGIAYRDDSQVVAVQVEKRYSDTPQVSVRLERIDGNEI